MATSPPSSTTLPQVPPLTKEGFQDPVWMKWLQILQLNVRKFSDAIFGVGGLPTQAIHHDTPTTYVPTATPTAGAFGTVATSGSFIQLGSLLFVRVTIAVVNAGTASGSVIVSLPVAASSLVGGTVLLGGREDGITGHVLTMTIGAGNVTGVVAQFDGSTAIATGAILDVSGVYITA